MVRVLSVRVGEAIADAELHGGEVTRPIVGPIVVGGEHRWPSQGRPAGGRSVVAGAGPPPPPAAGAGGRPSVHVVGKGGAPERAGGRFSPPHGPHARGFAVCRRRAPARTGT